MTTEEFKQELLDDLRRDNKEFCPTIYYEVQKEVEFAQANWPAFNSAHEGFAVLLEEVDELKDHVWTNQKKRNLEEMRKEAIQVAAMGIRFALDICDGDRGRK